MKRSAIAKDAGHKGQLSLSHLYQRTVSIPQQFGLTPTSAGNSRAKLGPESQDPNEGSLFELWRAALSPRCPVGGASPCAILLREVWENHIGRSRATSGCDPGAVATAGVCSKRRRAQTRARRSR